MNISTEPLDNKKSVYICSLTTLNVVLDYIIQLANDFKSPHGLSLHLASWQQNFDPSFLHYHITHSEIC